MPSVHLEFQLLWKNGSSEGCFKYPYGGHWKVLTHKGAPLDGKNILKPFNCTSAYACRIYSTSATAGDIQCETSVVFKLTPRWKCTTKDSKQRLRQVGRVLGPQENTAKSVSQYLIAVSYPISGLYIVQPNHR